MVHWWLWRRGGVGREKGGEIEGGAGADLAVLRGGSMRPKLHCW